MREQIRTLAIFLTPFFIVVVIIVATVDENAMGRHGRGLAIILTPVLMAATILIGLFGLMPIIRSAFRHRKEL